MSDGGDPIRTRPEDDVSEGALSRELIAQNQHEIGRADGKAAILLVTGVSLVGLLFVHRPTAPGLLWWTASATTTTAIVCLLLALFPADGSRPAVMSSLTRKTSSTPTTGRHSRRPSAATPPTPAPACTAPSRRPAGSPAPRTAAYATRSASCSPRSSRPCSPLWRPGEYGGHEPRPRRPSGRTGL